MTRTENKLENLSRAVKRLGDAVTHFRSTGDEFARDALIQRFEFSFELAWKTTCEFLAAQGLSNVLQAPRPVLKAAYQAGLLDDEALWLEMLLSRNDMSHHYDEGAADKTAEEICLQYYKALRALCTKLKSL